MMPSVYSDIQKLEKGHGEKPVDVMLGPTQCVRHALLASSKYSSLDLSCYCQARSLRPLGTLRYVGSVLPDTIRGSDMSCMKAREW